MPFRPIFLSLPGKTVFTENALVVSDTATSSMSSYADVTPVGTDFYRIGKQGKQYGPFGLLEPLQDPPGRGFFSCVDEDVLGGPSRGENL